MSKLRVQNALFFIFSTTVIVGGGIVALLAANGTALTPRGLAQTGTLRLSINPASDVKVFLDEQEKRVSSNNTLDNLLPGEYELRIQREDYNTWSQRVSISSGIVTDVSVQLFPGKSAPEQVTKTNIDQFFTSSSKRYVYYSVIDSPIGSNMGIWQQTLQQSSIPLIQEQPVKITNLTAEIASYVQKGEYTLLPSPNDARVLLQIPTGYYLLDTNRYNEPQASNSLVFTFPVDSVEWLTDNNNLLIKSGTLLLDYDIEKKLATVITYSVEQPIYSKAAGGVFYISGSKLYRYTPSSNVAVKLENVSLPKVITKISSSNDSDKSLIIQSENKLSFLDITTSTLTELGSYELISISPSGRNLLVNNASQLESLEVNVSIVRDTVEVLKRKATLPAAFIRSSLVWSPNSVYFVYQIEGEVAKIYSADKTGNNNTLILESANLVSGKLIIPSDNSGIIMKLNDTATGTAEQARFNLYKLLLAN